MSEMLDINAAADFLGLSPKTLRKVRSTGQGPLAEIPCVRYSSRCIKYRKSDLDAWLEKNTHVPAAGGAAV